MCKENSTTKGEVIMYYGKLEEQIKMETLKKLREHGELKDYGVFSRYCTPITMTYYLYEAENNKGLCTSLYEDSQWIMQYIEDIAKVKTDYKNVHKVEPNTEETNTFRVQIMLFVAEHLMFKVFSKCLLNRTNHKDVNYNDIVEALENLK